jgi:ABC-2 type transport system permease protein
MSMQVREGTLAAKLLRPVHPLYAFAAQHLAAVPMRALTIVPIVGILVYKAGGTLARHDLRLGAMLAAALLGAWLLNFFLMVMLGSLAFFIESALGIYELWFAVYSIFSGYLVPLEALPGWVQGAARVLPFRFMLALPVETLAGLLGPGEAARLLAWQWVYVAGAATAALAVWRAGVRRFSAYGG